MISDKEIIMNVIERAISNFTAGTALSWFADPITEYVCKAISPYIDIFTDSKGHFESSTATAFLQKKTEDEIKKFKEEYYHNNDNNSSNNNNDERSKFYEK